MFLAVARYLDSKDSRQFRSYVESGFTVEVVPEAFGPCVVRELVEMPSFELGVDRTELIEKRIVAGLKPGSNAEKAGLREGDTVIGISVYWNDTSKPVRLTIQRGTTKSTIEYYARGASRGLVPQYAFKGLLHGGLEKCQVPAAIH